MTSSSEDAPWAAMILTGGRSSRLGQDKSVALVAGRPMLEWVLASVGAAKQLVVVGPRPPIELPVGVRLVREDPPGGGPVAAIAAGLPLVATDVVVIVATDLPFLGDLPSRLAHTLAGSAADAVLAVDAQGREQPLCAAYRRHALAQSLAGMPTAVDQSMRRLVEPLGWGPFHPDGPHDPTVDVDTPEQLRAALERAAKQSADADLRRPRSTD